jgi:hypothetical protein
VHGVDEAQPFLHAALDTSFSTVAVMFTKPRRPGTSNQSCSVSDFMPAHLAAATVVAQA